MIISQDAKDSNCNGVNKVIMNAEQCHECRTAVTIEVANNATNNNTNCDTNNDKGAFSGRSVWQQSISSNCGNLSQQCLAVKHSLKSVSS